MKLGVVFKKAEKHKKAKKTQQSKTKQMNKKTWDLLKPKINSNAQISIV